jgi:hypothetical protein
MFGKVCAVAATTGSLWSAVRRRVQRGSDTLTRYAKAPFFPTQSFILTLSIVPHSHQGQGRTKASSRKQSQQGIGCILNVETQIRIAHGSHAYAYRHDAYAALDSCGCDNAATRRHAATATSDSRRKLFEHDLSYCAHATDSAAASYLDGTSSFCHFLLLNILLFARHHLLQSTKLFPYTYSLAFHAV